MLLKLIFHPFPDTAMKYRYLPALAGLLALSAGPAAAQTSPPPQGKRIKIRGVNFGYDRTNI